MEQSLTVERKFYSVDETASMLGCTEVTIRRWVMDGTIGSVKIGGRRLIPAKIIEELIESAQPKEEEAA
ncbi:MAG: helix-turn-helix domain-containing protein [Coriobacteriia bacterium]